MSTEERVGLEVARRVADRLEDGDVLANDHRDFCGMGLELFDGTFVYGRVWDGWVRRPRVADLHGDAEGAEFETRRAFVEWLARQTDDSLSGADLERDFYRRNQRLTLARLRAFADGEGRGANQWQR